MTALSDALIQNQGLGWTGGPCAAKSGTRAPLGLAPMNPKLVRSSILSQISMPAGLAVGQQRWIHVSPPEGPSLHQGQCLTRISPLDSCRQCRASSWLVPAPGKILEQAAVSRSSTGFKGERGGGRAHGEGREEISFRAGPSPPTYPTAHLHLLAWGPSHLASASPGYSLSLPTAATPSRLCGGPRLPGHGPSLRGFPLGTESPR